MQFYNPYEDYKETCKFRISELSFAFTCENEGIDEFVALVEKTKMNISFLEGVFFKQKVFLFRPIYLNEENDCNIKNIYFEVKKVPQKNIYKFLEMAGRKDITLESSISNRKGVKWLVIKVILPKQAPSS